MEFLFFYEFTERNFKNMLRWLFFVVSVLGNKMSASKNICVFIVIVSTCFYVSFFVRKIFDVKNQYFLFIVLNTVFFFA